MSDHADADTVSQAHNADIEYFVRRGMTKGYQLMSVATPVVYAVFATTRYGRGHLNVNRLLRATWMGGSVGIVGGGAFEYARSAYSYPEHVRIRRYRTAYDTASLRADDHSTIGGILFAVITPALFWKRANSINLILGGAGVGSAIGLIAHYARNITGDPAPPIMVPDVPPAALH